MFPEIEEIKRRRKKLGISQKKLAELVGVSQPLIARIESGDFDPKLSLIKKIFRVFEEIEGKSVDLKKIMNTPVKSVKPETPIKEAVEEMMVDGISQMPVIDGEEVVGSITESSIVRAVMEKGSGAEMLQVKDVMEDPFPMIDPNESLNTVSKLLTESQAVLVVENGKVVGIITKHDLMKFLKIPR